MGLGKMMETGDLLIELRMRQADDVVAILTIMETGDLHSVVPYKPLEGP